jgi:hypothetical protein
MGFEPTTLAWQAARGRLGKRLVSRVEAPELDVLG